MPVLPAKIGHGLLYLVAGEVIFIKLEVVYEKDKSEG
jgi:hypothetical protein